MLADRGSCDYKIERSGRHLIRNPTESRWYNEHESENGEREDEPVGMVVRVSNVESPDRSIAWLRSSFNQIIHAPPMKRGQ